jgi:hypothetical protein
MTLSDMAVCRRDDVAGSVQSGIEKSSLIQSFLFFSSEVGEWGVEVIDRKCWMKSLVLSFIPR